VAGGFTEGKGSRKHLGALRTARISANAIVRRARSLFSPRKLRHLAVVLPRPLPFEGIEFEARQSMKYRSEIDVEKLIAHARQELEYNDPEAYKVFLHGKQP
jgi:hypothetical protein